MVSERFGGGVKGEYLGWVDNKTEIIAYSKR